MFNLPEVAELLKFPEVHLYTIDQCMYGALYKKSTSFLGTLPIPELRCDHQPVWWKVPWSGGVLQGPASQVAWASAGSAPRQLVARDAPEVRAKWALFDAGSRWISQGPEHEARRAVLGRKAVGTSCTS